MVGPLRSAGTNLEALLASVQDSDLTGFKFDPSGVSAIRDGGSMSFTGTFSNGGPASIRWSRAAGHENSPDYNKFFVRVGRGDERPLRPRECADLARVLTSAVQSGTAGIYRDGVAMAAIELGSMKAAQPDTATTPGVTLGPRANFLDPKVAAYLKDPDFQRLPFNFGDRNPTTLNPPEMAQILNVPRIKENPGAFIRTMVAGSSGVMFSFPHESACLIARTLGQANDPQGFIEFRKLAVSMGSNATQLQNLDDAFRSQLTDQFESRPATLPGSAPRPAASTAASLQAPPAGQPTYTGFQLASPRSISNLRDGRSTEFQGTFAQGGPATIRWSRAKATQEGGPGLDRFTVTPRNGSARELTSLERLDLASAFEASMGSNALGGFREVIAAVAASLRALEAALAASLASPTQGGPGSAQNQTEAANQAAYVAATRPLWG